LNFRSIKYYIRKKKWFALDAGLGNLELKITYKHETQVDFLEKYPPRAGQKSLAGRIWPAGRTLLTPDLTGPNCFEVIRRGLT